MKKQIILFAGLLIIMATGSAVGKTESIDAAGFYFKWQKFGSDTNLYKDNGTLTGIHL